MSVTARPAYRVFVSVPLDQSLLPGQQQAKSAFIDLLEQDGFEPQIIGEKGRPAASAWTYEKAESSVADCQGAVVLGLTRFECSDGTRQLQFTTEYSHFEGALAVAHKRPLLLLIEQGVLPRGVLALAAGQIVVEVPPNADSNWFATDRQFRRQYEGWRDKVQSRYHLFLGYSSGARGTAAQIIDFLRGNGVRVLDWATGFASGGTILTQIEDADTQCLGGLFVFTKDDDLVSGDQSHAAPRDNVIFEAGYFMNSKGDARVLIIREEDAKMPADLGGQIYLSLKDRNDISPIHTSLLKFVQTRL